MNDFLSLGSVVLLKDAKKKLMICGRCQNAEGSDKLYDYCGCYYPEGIINSNQLFMFNNEDIERIYYIGMQDEDEFAFRQLLHKELNKEDK